MKSNSDLRVQRTYASLAAAFEELLSEKGFDEITVNELCQRAMIRRPTFYSHFEDKYDYLRFYLNEVQARIERQSEAEAESVADSFVRNWRSLIGFVDAHPDLIQTGMKDKSLPIIFEILTEHLEAAFSAKLKSVPDIAAELPGSVDTLASFVAGGLVRTLKRYLSGGRDGSKRTAEDLADMFTYIWNTVLPEK